VLHAVEQTPQSVGLGLGVPPPDFGLNVVRENNSGARQMTGQVHSGDEKVAHEEIESALAE
jgi:hypothetical protein